MSTMMIGVIVVVTAAAIGLDVYRQARSQRKDRRK